MDVMKSVPSYTNSRPLSTLFCAEVYAQFVSQFSECLSPVPAGEVRRGNPPQNPFLESVAKIVGVRQRWEDDGTMPLLSETPLPFCARNECAYAHEVHAKGAG